VDHAKDCCEPGPTPVAVRMEVPKENLCTFRIACKGGGEEGWEGHCQCRKCHHVCDHFVPVLKEKLNNQQLSMIKIAGEEDVVADLVPG